MSNSSATSSGNSIFISSGTVSGVVLSNPGSGTSGFWILSATEGGTAVDTVLANSGTYAYAVSGGVLSDTYISSGGMVETSAGGTVIGGEVYDNGTIYASSGGTVIDMELAQGGQLYVFSGGTAEGTVLDASALETVYAGGSVFNETVLSGGLEMLSGTASGDTLNDGSSTLDFSLAADDADYTNASFILSEDQLDNVEVSVACYCRGTQIETEHGDLAVEDLQIGDMLRTASGALRPIRWIGKRNYAGLFSAGNSQIAPVTILANALADGIPRRNLQVSPMHAMYLDGALVPASALVNDISIFQNAPGEDIEYYHLELESHDILIAEGALSESFIDDDSRGMFHNAHEFQLLYPDAPTDAAQYCAPHLEGGARLEAVRHALVLRAARTFGKPGTTDEDALALDGFLDTANRDRIQGWAWNRTAPHQAVSIDILVNGEKITRGIANSFRQDLAGAGIGKGWHGFSIPLPHTLSLSERHVVEARHAGTGIALTGSPIVIEPANRFDLELEAQIQRAVDAIDSQPDRLRALDFMLSQADRIRQRQADASSGRLDHAASRHARHLADAATPNPTSPHATSLNPGATPPRALFVDQFLPRAGHDAGSQAALSHISALQRLDYEVSLASMETEPAPETVEALEQNGISVLRRPFYSGVEDIMQREAGLFDVVYLHRAGPASAYAGLARRHVPQARLIYNVADLHHVRLAPQAQVENRPELNRHAAALRRLECSAALISDVVITHSPVEQAQLQRMVPGAAIRTVPWSIAPHPAPAPFQPRNGVAFFAHFRHTPNMDAALWLLDHIMPLVWRERPDIRCLIAGTNIPASLREHATRINASDNAPHNAIEIIGRIENPAANLFDRARLSIAPLRFGAGIKGKVLESMAAGTPCIMTGCAAEGMELTAEMTGLVADEAAELASLILRYHDDEASWTRNARAGSKLIQDHHSEARIDQALATAIGAPPSPLRATA